MASAPLALPTAPSCARRQNSAVRSAHDDRLVIVPPRRLLLWRRVGGC